MMMMKGIPRIKLKLRYAVVLVDVDLSIDDVRQTDLRFFDEYCDAELWIKTNGSLYGVGNRPAKISRFFRIEKRYYLA